MGREDPLRQEVHRVIRSTFLIAPDGTIARPWYHVKADGHAAKVLAEIDA